MKMIFNSTKKRHVATARRALQIVVAFFALVPILAGLAGIFHGPEMVNGISITNASMDSHYRYLSGLLMGVGLGFWTTIPNIEEKTMRFRLLTAIVFLGGLGRLYSLVTIGAPDRVMLFGLAMELAVTPLLALWQGAVARQS
jgi:hypothetical protein